MIWEKPTTSKPAATVRADSDGRRRLSIQYRGVGVEGVLHGLAHAPVVPRRVDSPQVALDHRPPLDAGEAGAERDRRCEALGDEARATPGRPALRCGTRRASRRRRGALNGLGVARRRSATASGAAPRHARAATLAARHPPALAAGATQLDARRGDRCDLRLAPHLDEPLAGGDRRQRQHQPQHGDRAAARTAARCTAGRPARRAPSGRPWHRGPATRPSPAGTRSATTGP